MQSHCFDSSICGTAVGFDKDVVNKHVKSLKGSMKNVIKNVKFICVEKKTGQLMWVIILNL